MFFVVFQLVKLVVADLKLSIFFDELHSLLIEHRPTPLLILVEVKGINQNSISDDLLNLIFSLAFERIFLKRAFFDKLIETDDVFPFFLSQ